jgi:hypothetical protein
VRDRDEARACGQQPFVLVQPQVAGFVDRNNPKGGSPFFAGNLPGHDVGVVLHLRHHDFVARVQMCAAPHCCHQVDGLGRPPDENDLLRERRVDNRWTVMRARSYSVVACSLSPYTPRCTLAFSSA